MHPLPVEAVHPVIRIAHRRVGPLAVPERIIFDHELVLMLDGEVTFDVGGPRSRQQRQVVAHEVLWIEPFVPHSLTSPTDRRCEHLAVHLDLAPDVPGDEAHLDRRRPCEVRLPRGLRLPEQARLQPTDGIEARLIELVDRWQAGSALDRLDARVLLERVLVALLRRAYPSTGRTAPGSVAADAGHESARDRARLERAIRLIERDYARPLTVDDLADAADLGASHFTRLFRRWTGYAPMAYLRCIRIDRARRLLADPALSVKQVARLTGFADPYHFSKAFRHLDGLSPTLYREAALAGRATRPSDDEATP